MGYSDEQGQLDHIAHLAREIGDLLDVQNPGGNFPPPQKIVDEMRPALNYIIELLMSFRYRIEGSRPRESVVSKVIDEWIKPESIDEIYALKKGNGLFIRTSPAYERGTKHPGLWEEFQPSPVDGISVAVYVDSGSPERDQEFVHDVESLISTFGYEESSEVETRLGSIFRTWKAKAIAALTSDELKERLSKLERGVELAQLDLRQAEVDRAQAEAVSKLVHSLQDIPYACVRAGSILLLKFMKNGQPVLVQRNLSQLEIRACERYPEIQANPEKTLEMLATAVDSLVESTLQPPAQGPPALEGPPTGGPRTGS